MPFAGLDDLGAIDPKSLSGRLDGKLVSLDRLGGIKLCGLLRLHLPGYHVVGKDGGELFLVLGLEERLDGSLWELGESFVGRSENGEGALSLEGVYEPGGLDRRDESLETTGTNGCVDDVLLGLYGQDDEGKGKRE